MLGPVRARLIGTLLASCALLGACHHGASSTTPLVKRHAGAGSGPNPGAVDIASGPTDLVSAVSGGAGGEGPVGLKFQVARRPVAGQPVVVTLRLAANQALDHLEARFRPDEGLAVTQGADFDPRGHLDAGESVDHDLTLIPDHDGIYTVLATVTTGSADAAVSRSFVIPIVVGSEVAVAKPK
ncbi:MAG TPA: hypothetical protein VGV09_15915 [Steroidobacteraceae bacterium]|nr:hypothetical protein [Steroidobacteraceae bacterium]